MERLCQAKILVGQNCEVLIVESLIERVES